MRIVITGGKSLLTTAVAAALGGEHDVRTLSCDPREVEEGLIGDSEVLIHLDPVVSDGVSNGHHDVLDRSTRGTYTTLKAAIDSGVRRIIVGSSLSLLDRYPGTWAVSESWEPRPDVDDLRQLSIYLLEQSARQFAFFEEVEIVALRFGKLIDHRGAQAGRDWSWIHVDDAVQAVEKALTVASLLPTQIDPPTRHVRHGWRVFHIAGAGHTRVSSANATADLGFLPRYDLTPGAAPLPTEQEDAGDLRLLGPDRRIPSRPIRRVLVLGGGGPLAAASYSVLSVSHTLRFADRLPIAEIAAGAGRPRSIGAPLPFVLPAPHETIQVDITDFRQVMRACRDIDAIVNCAVVRNDLKDAFLVNCIGAYNVMKAAVAHDIRRIVHTGPQQVAVAWPAGYGWDFRVPDDAPARAGRDLYHHTKLLGQEVVRLFAETYDLEVAALHFSSLVNPGTAQAKPGGVGPMSISWEDAGRAVGRALDVPMLPSPFEVFHIVANLPHGKYSNRKARLVLGWRPRDTLHNLWAHRQVVRGDS